MRGPGGSNSTPYRRSTWARTWLPSPSRNRPPVLPANSQAMPAMTMGLTGKATAIPVDSSSVGAAVAADAMLIHGVWPVSVKTIPENPARSTTRASSPAADQLVGPTITSKCIRAPFGTSVHRWTAG